MSFTEAIKAGSARRPAPKALAGKFQYGTAGFRMKADSLDAVVYRVGLLASLRSRFKNGRTIGVMITASHNPPQDNGVKLVDPFGDMLESSWEQYATQLANAMTDDDLDAVFNKIATEHKINLSAPAKVIYARDTRASGSRLVECLVDALKATNVEHTDFKIATTPQLHYYVRCINTKGTQDAYGEPTEQGYYEKLGTAFKQVMESAKPTGGVIVDCANGVGGPKLRELMKHLPQGLLDIKVVNDDVHKPDSLNHQCGADYVKTTQSAPPSSKAAPNARCCSLDGDADRIVYYFLDDDKVFRLLDGDRIATLAATFIGDLARKAGLADKINIGVVQTAYANGASTHFVERNLKLPVECTPTGVKHLHHAALRFDVGVYFEANGHGTVLFSESALKTIHTYEPSSPAQADALTTLIGLTDLINQTVGDALSDMLLVEAVLAHKNWTCTEWFHTYKDLPNRLARVEVDDRNAFKTVPGTAERKLASPAGVQEAIDGLVVKYTDARSFVRASGTEDAVRVYAEARTTAESQDLCRAVEQVVRRYGSVNSQ
ncbi:N-acetylglucosamine-phosphate mutase-like protein [Myriangium duriaei CBS 260.36]|uniref:Phosphoacetylglucosamine mutase n=1 Tax=Myriangium duriaei CBS 260.36 TaxID=1168546 RepID=A0A9P4J262_9PEZI|nr:N-acetylglucosamine-phosphate mutase-like protein [Myriangium duriaei CBS 260.36]